MSLLFNRNTEMVKKSFYTATWFYRRRYICLGITVWRAASPALLAQYMRIYTANQKPSQRFLKQELCYRFTSKNLSSKGTGNARHGDVKTQFLLVEVRRRPKYETYFTNAKNASQSVILFSQPKISCRKYMFLSIHFFRC